ncbi:MAG: hypothetical protein AB1714_06640 [Acidobacteriota bacterium]
MIIANPIYDSVFKYLMEDNRVARLVISTIIGEEVVELEMRPQERAARLSEMPVSVFRIDFAAIVRTTAGEMKNVLIEIQKAKYLDDIMRFRKYLGEQYMRLDNVRGPAGPVTIALPIVAIYILGFQLDNIEAEAVRVNRSYYDAITGEELHVKNEFIERLSHDAYVIQVPRLKPRRRNRLEALLSVFDQRYRKESDRYVLDLQEELPPEIEPVVKRLERAAMDSEIRATLEMADAYDGLMSGMDRALAEKDAALAEKDAALAEKEAALAEQERLIAELRRKLGESE